MMTKPSQRWSFSTAQMRWSDMTRQHIVFLTGAGVSAESGLSTFRGKDGLWTNEEWAYLASTEALYNDTQRCLDFYNWRRKQLSEVEPNDAHRMIAELEKEHEVTVITQNVDAPVYNMMGQRVDKSQKGLVIYKGKKYVNK